MRAVLERVRVLRDGFGPPRSTALRWDAWQQHVQAAAGSPSLPIRLVASSREPRIKLPFKPEPCLVGRNSQIETVLSELERDARARVLIGGEPGMGKDVVAVQALHDDRARALVRPALRGFMPYWLPATTADDLRGKLRQLGVDYLGADPTADQTVVLEHVRAWFTHEDNADWLLYLEDLNTESCKELREWVPDGAPGRLLVTSNQQLGEAELGTGWAVVKLDELKTGAGVGDNEALQLLDKACHQLNSTAVFNDEERAILATFFDQQLGNLPLSVSIVAHLLAGSDLRHLLSREGAQ